MNGMSSTGTQINRDRAYWTAVIHNAAKVTPDSPRYSEARQVAQMAIENLGALMDRKNAADQPAPVTPSKPLGAAMGAFQGLTSGLGDEALGGLAGLATLLTGGGNQQATNRIQQTQAGFREQSSNFRGAHPAIAIGSDLYGTAFNPLNKALGPLTEGLGPVAKGAVYGVTLGGARGFGEGTGTPKERVPSAALGAAIGLVAGSALGKAIKIVGPTVGKLVANAQRILGPNAAPAEIASTVETSIRARLIKMNVAPEDIERAIQSWRATGELSVRSLAQTHPPIPPEPVAVRPGETITPIAPKGFAVTGPAPPLNQGPFPPTITEMQGFSTAPRGLPDIGRGQTMPYYPRGGQVEQAFGAQPVVSNPNAQLEPALGQLKMLMQMSDAELAQVEGMFPPAIMQQIRAFRAQGGAR
jgi:hypothetical protein